MESNIKISVIVPIYGTEAFIPKTIQSLVNQTFKEFEVILVDDESPDNACDVAEKLLNEAGTNFVILKQKNQGQGFSRNNGVAAASGDWLLFLDSDDILQPRTLELLYQAGVEHDADFVFSNFQYVTLGNEFQLDESVETPPIVFDRSGIQMSFLLRNHIILVPGTLYNKGWYRVNGFAFKKIPYSEDQLFIWEILLKTNKAVKINNKLYNYLLRENSIMSGSKFSQIIQGYPYFEKMEDTYFRFGYNEISKFLLSRWVFGIMHSAAKLCSKDEYAQLSKIFHAKKHYKNLISFPNLKIRGLSYICSASMNISYFLNKNL